VKKRKQSKAERREEALFQFPMKHYASIAALDGPYRMPAGKAQSDSDRSK